MGQSAAGHPLTSEEACSSEPEASSDQLRALIETTATNPAMLSEDNLAQLASLLGGRAP